MINELEEIKELFDEFYLIDEPHNNVVKENKNPIKINFEGGNKTGLVFVFEQSLSVEDKEMIHNLIHKAMKLTMEDLAFVDLSVSNGVSLSQMINIIKASRVVVWGAENWIMQDLTSVTQYEVLKLNESSIISVDTVSTYLRDIPQKTKLWNAIQLLLKV
ncbi:hypothetical protein AEM51_10315 [Bacteroidetes bacterium UKL13-3]|jgi:hypothetical protein|nr:hypothetical protein AEM51_10315 [Bacteroidetes bacterium UKL13-3]HCP94129.1 hypothetical protein [Bacteroidota bacterium]